MFCYSLLMLMRVPNIFIRAHLLQTFLVFFKNLAFLFLSLLHVQTKHVNRVRGALLGMKAGMGKSRTVRHHIPNIPPVSRIGGKNRNKKLPEKYGQERERKWLRRFPSRIFGFPYRARKIPVGIPVPLPHFGPFLPISAAQPNSAPRAQRAPKFGSAPRSPAPQTLKAPNFSPFPPHISRPPPHTLSESQSLSLPQTAVSHSRSALAPLARSALRQTSRRPPQPSDRRPVPRRPLALLARSALQQSLPPSPSDRRCAARRPPTGERRREPHPAAPRTRHP